MPSNQALGVYLNDHLAGSAAGIELAEKLRDNNQGKEAAGWLLEKLNRLRLNPARTGSAELTRLLETEAPRGRRGALVLELSGP
jgi:hypothetical protein